MNPIDRRAFLLSSLAAAPLAACAPAALVSNPPSALGGQGIHTAAGQDRLGSPKTVLGGLRIDGKVLPDDSGGALYIIEHSDHAKGGPARHFHHEQDEWFYVLEGAYRIEVGDERRDVGPGDSVFAPRRVPHVWAPTGEGIGRLLIAFPPAGRMESFLAALAQAGSAPSPEVLRPLFAAHGMTVVGPPLAV